MGKIVHVGIRNKPIIISDLQLNLQNHINISCCSFNKYSMHLLVLLYR